MKINTLFSIQSSRANLLNKIHINFCVIDAWEQIQRQLRSISVPQTHAHTTKQILKTSILIYVVNPVSNSGRQVPTDFVTNGGDKLLVTKFNYTGIVSVRRSEEICGGRRLCCLRCRRIYRRNILTLEREYLWSYQ